MPNRTEAFHARTAEEVTEALGVNPRQGLSSDQVAGRREQVGENRIRQSGGRSLRRILIAQFRSVVVALLAGAAVLAFVFEKLVEGIAILAVILVNCLIGFISEWRAARSMEALRQMGKPRVRVRRYGEESEVPATKLVPGDICLHESGDMLPADLRLIEANNLQVDESMLTGESVSVSKQTDPVEADRPPAERTGMLYRGSTITQGSAVGIVVATGMDTELGHIAGLTEEAADAETTPLERRLNRLGQRLAWVALAAAAVIGVTGFLAGRPILLMIETAIALGVAAIPEGLPFVATIVLARGMWLMARKQALINRLPAVETLGATNVILSDKTGTLTENRMVAAALVTPSGEHDLQPDNAPDQEPDKAQAERDPFFSRALEIGALCNNASVSDKDEDGEIDETQGDPTEIALLTGAARWGVDRRKLLERKPEVREKAFDPDTMMIATVHESEGSFEYAVKGAPGAVIGHCRTVAGEQEAPMDEEQRETWNRKARDLAAKGLRVLALADKNADTADADLYEDLRLVGLVGLFDPPADEVRKSLDACRRAGIRVVMVTGDQPETARAIASDLGLIDKQGASVLTGNDLGDLDALSAQDKQRIRATRVFARVSPEQKLGLLTLFQQRGNTVAMTGDGVNDAPALKKADIGVSMGKRGTDVARETVTACALLLVAAVYAPGLSNVLETERPGSSGWLVILVLSALPTLAGQIRMALGQPRS